MDLQIIVRLGFTCFILLFIIFIMPINRWHFLKMEELQPSHHIAIIIAVLATIAMSTIPMSLSPYWNGTLQELSDKQQYDRMGDALLEGHLYIDDGNIDRNLKEMDNPYDKFERERLGVKFNWDEAYYNGHYYMYFGVVPTIILFIPFKLLTGTALLSYQATQVFAALTIVGLFFLFYMLCLKFFPKFPFSLYMLLSASFSILSIGYSIAAPALYCTAIVSGICMMVWCIIFFFKGAWNSDINKIGNLNLFIGALLGALAFGCRPPVALANMLVVVVVYRVWNNKIFNKNEKIRTIILMLIPYFTVGALLMLYNYARFGNLFEFGQSYQLTLADQHNYRSFIERFNLEEILVGLWLNMYAPCGLTDSFPFLRFNGVFINYPILLLSSKLFSKRVKVLLKERKLYLLSVFTFLISCIIILFDVYWSPFLSKRYHLDFLYLLCITTFLSIASWLELISQNKRKYLICFITLLAFYVFIAEFLFFCIPFDGNYIMHYPEKLNEIYKGLRFGL